MLHFAANMIVTPSAQNLDQAVKLLKQAQLVGFPTETVYGLGADASNAEAVNKIFSAKGRPADHPLIVHIATKEAMTDWATTIPKEAYTLADAFWPGALTLILKRAANVPDSVTGGQDTIGLRIPSHPVALKLLKAFEGGVAAPSANKFGRISPTTAQHVQEELANEVSMILDGGACNIGLESTIVDLSFKESNKAQVLRPGGVGVEALRRVLGYEPEMKQETEIRASGLLESHYAPRTPAVLVNLLNVPNSFDSAVIALEVPPKDFKGIWLRLDSNAERYGHQLYSALRQLDDSDTKMIYIQQVPNSLAWLAVRDRLKRATAAYKAN